MDYRSTIIGILGLAPEASDEEITAASSTFGNDMVSFRNEQEDAVQTAVNGHEAAAAQVAGLTEDNTNLTGERDVLQEELVNADIESFKDVIEDDEEEEIKADLLENRAKGLKYLNRLRSQQTKFANSAAGVGVSAKVGKLHNSATAKLPNGGRLANGVDAPKLENSAKAEAAKIMNRSTELQKMGVDFRTATARAKAEIRG